MKKILMLILFVSSVNAELVLTQEVIHDGMLNGLNGVFKEITGQNDKAHEENCKKEYKKLYERNSQLLEKSKEENLKLKEIISMNSLNYEDVKINHLKIRKNEKCSVEYWDYFKSTNHEISELQKENRKIKLLLRGHNINYEPLLKRKPTIYSHKEVTQGERKQAKEALKKQMSF